VERGEARDIGIMTHILAAGLGCRKDCPGSEIADLVRLALDEAGLDLADLSGLFAPAFKQGEAGLTHAAAELGVPLVLMPEAALKEAEPRALTRSERVVALTGLGSVAETAALAGAGPNSRLVRARIASAHATCALALSE
jgi:cobalt-precorrin 5A hydrolase